MSSEIKKCSGCGVSLQDDNMLQEGYTTSLENDICQRCFRMKNYGEYQVVAKSNEEYLEILKGVGQTKDLVLYVTDLLNLEEDILKIREYINELGTEIDRLESDLEKQMTGNVEACQVTATESRLNAIIEVKNDLLGRLEEVI